ncbi:MAG: hypothetical protein E6I32_14520 [Chloroflexi bacterium]|nr:MAG: hypothetical protein E6I32_14520 [Chloroflexota bacterium]
MTETVIVGGGGGVQFHDTVTVLLPCPENVIFPFLQLIDVSDTVCEDWPGVNCPPDGLMVPPTPLLEDQFSVPAGVSLTVTEQV